MKDIWAPWRIEYITQPKVSACFLCEAPSNNDPHILTRGADCYAIMNRFPYTSGHCMVVPYRHTGDIAELTDAELTGIMSMVRSITAAMREAMHPDGFNVGCNLGKAAGAGVADHFHMHIVPRWNGDTNFMPVLSDVHVISEYILQTRDRIAKFLS